MRHFKGLSGLYMRMQKYVARKTNNEMDEVKFLICEKFKALST